ncbi:hypothetical protein pb186bvf_007631 [Paramecium bursaria]
MSRRKWRSIGREIEYMRKTQKDQDKSFSHLTEAQITKRATNLLQKPFLVKVQKHRKEGIIKPQKIAEAIREQLNIQKPPENNFSDMLSVMKVEEPYVEKVEKVDKVDKSEKEKPIQEQVKEQSQSYQEHSEQTQVTNNCFEIDFNWVEYCDDEKFKKMFSDDLKDVDDIEQYVEDNQSYLCHVFAQCACAKCTCNRCYCSFKKPSYPLSMITTSRMDFQPKNPIETTPIIRQEHYDSMLQSSGGMNFTTSYKDYAFWPPKQRSQSISTKRKLINDHRVITKTHNNVTFVDWKDYRNQIFYAPQHVSTLGGPLLNQTIYKGSFDKKQVMNQMNAEQVKEKQLNQTFTKMYNIPTKTQYQQDFIPKQLRDKNTFKYQEIYTDNYMLLKAHNQQYQTSSQEFQFRGIEKQQQRPWKGKLAKKLYNIK